MINGPGINEGVNFDAEIIDMAPTVLAYLDLPVPRHIGGKVLNRLFVEAPEVRYEQMEFSRSGKSEYTDAEQAEVEKQLADLGYI